MQTDTAIGIGATGTVFQVALDGTTDRCKLAAYLVVTSGLEIDFQEAVVLATHEGAVGQYGLLGLFIAGLGDKGFVEFLVAGQIVLQARFGGFRASLDDGPVGLF